MDLLKQPQFFSIIYVYDCNFRACVDVNRLPPFIAQHILSEHYEGLKCTCGCGQTHQVVTKETMEVIIAGLASKRIAELN